MFSSPHHLNGDNKEYLMHRVLRIKQSNIDNVKNKIKILQQNYEIYFEQYKHVHFHNHFLAH